MNNSQKILQSLKSYKNKVSQFETMQEQYEDLLLLIDLGLEENDISIFSEVKSSMKQFINSFDELTIATLLSAEYDKNNALVTLHSGAGGTEACDWVNMLLRMYTRWADKKNFNIEILDYLQGEETGVKSVTFQVNGENAFGYLKCEKGVHRLVRMSPFDSSGRRHTSFAACDVMPELDDSISFEIDTEDLRIDTYRSSGAGGQHVNKTDSAIRITHLPTNTVVQCQNERSQHKNKDRAMKMLKGKLYELEQLKQSKLKDGLRGEVKEIGWGSQIRSYVFHPYNMVKDHRTNEEVGNVNAVMDGQIDVFINSFLSKLNNDRNHDI
jgi:peptide chain release factor 2